MLRSSDFQISSTISNDGSADHLALLPPELLRRVQCRLSGKPEWEWSPEPETRESIEEEQAPVQVQGQRQVQSISHESGVPQLQLRRNRGMPRESAKIPDIPELVGRVCSSEGCVVVVALTLPLVIGSALPFVAFAALTLHFVALAYESFDAVLHVGHHRPGLHLGSDADMISRGFHGLACILPVAIALWGWIQAAQTPEQSSIPELIVVFGTALFIPAAAMTAAISKSFISTINPLSWVRIIHRMGWSYGSHALGVAGLIVVAMIFRLHPWFDGGEISQLVRSFFSTALILMAALFTGRLLLIHHELFDLKLARIIALDENHRHEKSGQAGF